MLTTFNKPSEFGRIIKNSFWSFRGKVLHGLFLTVYYIMLARLLGTEGFGVFIGLLAFIGFVQPFFGIGSDSLFIREVARERGDYRRLLGEALLLHIGSGLLLGLLALLIDGPFLEESFPLLLIGSVIGAEICYKIVHLFGRAFQGFERLKDTSIIWMLTGFGKLVSVVLFWLLADSYQVVQWGLYYVGGALLIFFSGSILVIRELGIPRMPTAGYLKRYDWSEGTAFSLNFATDKIYSDVDKYMLLKLSGSGVAGLYGAAYQIIRAGLYPIIALLSAAYPRFFSKGGNNKTELHRFLKKMIFYSGGIGLFVSLCLFLAAPLLPYLLGSEYAETVTILRWLAVVPLLQSLYMTVGDALTGLDRQKTRTAIQMGIVVLNIGLNLWLIPIYGWWGAVVATLFSEIMLLAILAVTYVSMQGGRQSGDNRVN